MSVSLLFIGNTVECIGTTNRDIHSYLATMCIRKVHDGK